MRIAALIMGIVAFIGVFAILASGYTGNVVRTGDIPVMLQCNDNDGGIVPWIRGMGSAWADRHNVIVGTDVCYGDAAVYEFYCREGFLQSIILPCADMSFCKDGACVGVNG